MLNLEVKISEALDNIDSVTIPYLKELEGSIKQRLHTKGEDSSGQLIGAKNKRKGRYSPGYEKKRSKAGKSISPIDLEYHGDLRRSFTVGTSFGKPVLEFQDKENAKKAAYNEKNFNTELFKPSDQELDDGIEVMIIGVEELLKSIF